MVSGQFIPFINYRLRFVADGNDQILKLPLLSNEQGLISDITVLLATLLLPLTNGITIYYWTQEVKPTLFIWIAHPWLQLPLHCHFLSPSATSTLPVPEAGLEPLFSGLWGDYSATLQPMRAQKYFILRNPWGLCYRKFCSRKIQIFLISWSQEATLEWITWKVLHSGSC